MNMLRQRPLSLDVLRSFEAVARLLSFSAAAEEMHLTQPAVSRQIKALEEELGAALFQRGTRKVELTQAGRSLLRAVEPSLGKIDSAVRQIRLSRSRASVSVTTFPSFATLWLMPRLPDFERDHPGADIRLSATDRLIEVDDEELDLALRGCRPEHAPPGAVRLFGDLLTPVIGVRLAEAIARGDAPPLQQPGDLSGHTLVEMDDGSVAAAAQAWTAWLAPLGLEQLTPRRRITMNYTHQQTQAAIAGQGVALARLAMVHDVLERGDLIEPFGAAGRRWSTWCYWLVPLAGGSRRPEVEAFTRWVLEEAALTRQAIGDAPDVDTGAHGD
ncbi:LysR family transcriptional regulator [Sphaerotilus hippei]|uniref:LysR family transcriptional regulator n=1 Tax=Sphaerotilus hippei TaxID=744406 RepID=A0A318H7U8_9BURK|nr:LysR family transcriptional regulator [Sphaerotilus hippei]PXW97912.1 LysR family transcriptional regulator [Sphaerotilus hippei]